SPKVGRTTRVTICTGKVRTSTLHKGPDNKRHTLPPPTTGHHQSLTLMPIPGHPDGLQTPMGLPPGERGGQSHETALGPFSAGIINVGHRLDEPKKGVHD